MPKSLSLYLQIFIRLCIILTCAFFTIYLFYSTYIYTALLGALFTFLLLAEAFTFIKNSFTLYNRVIAAILNNDFSADFTNREHSRNYNSLFKLYEQLKHKQGELESKDLIYRSILNNIETGILILENTPNEKWAIFLMNDYFSKYFAAPKVSAWEHLKKHLPSLCTIIEDFRFENLKTPVQIQVGKQELQTFILQTSRTKAFNKDYYIIMLDSIQNVVEKREKEAWINLMKIISHELMNSLTPIRSLSQNLKEYTNQDILSSEDINDLRGSVDTIIKRSDHLQLFVDNYRKLAMLPSPKKEWVVLQELITNSLDIMSPLLKKEKISVENHIKSGNRIFADKLQMEQVFINLITNSIYALSEVSDKKIALNSELKNNRLFITISDTGNGVDQKIEKKIFLPFFTTRKEGAGIGLTLSKNIIEAHGGYLVLDQTNKRTSFIISLPE